MLLATEPDLFTIETITLPELEILAMVVVDAKTNTNAKTSTNAKISIDNKIGTNFLFSTHIRCHNPSFRLTIKVGACKNARQEGGLGETSYTPGSAGECEKMNPHTPKTTPTWGVGVPMDS